MVTVLNGKVEIDEGFVLGIAMIVLMMAISIVLSINGYFTP